MRARLIAGFLAVAALALLAESTSGRDGDEARWSSKETKRLAQLAEEYLEQESNSDRDAVLEKSREMGPVPVRKLKDIVKALFKVARSGPKSDGRGECTAKFPPFPGIYYLTGAGPRKGVVIGLHGGAPGVGSGRSAQSLWGGATSKGLIGAFPTANLEDRKTTWQSREVEAFVLALLNELKRSYRIDTNRVFLVGHSLGGSGAWHIGLKHADLFAGVSPNAGGLRGNRLASGEMEVPGGFVANLYNTPIFFTHYDRDPRVAVGDARAVAKELKALKEEHPDGYEHRYIEGEGPSHGFPPEGSVQDIIKWLTKRKRDPYPKKIVWEPWGPRRQFFWLRLSDPPLLGSRNKRIVATIEDNRIEITCGRTKGLSVLLAAEMFDPDKPVVVTVNGEEKWNEVVRTDPAALLECILEYIDPNQVFAYRIDL